MNYCTVWLFEWYYLSSRSKYYIERGWWWNWDFVFSFGTIWSMGMWFFIDILRQRNQMQLCLPIQLESCCSTRYVFFFVLLKRRFSKISCGIFGSVERLEFFFLLWRRPLKWTIISPCWHLSTSFFCWWPKDLVISIFKVLQLQQSSWHSVHFLMSHFLLSLRNFFTHLRRILTIKNYEFIT